MKIANQLLNGRKMTKTNRSFVKGWIAGVLVVAVLAVAAFAML